MENVFNKTLQSDWTLIKLITCIERFTGSWPDMQKREGASLKVLARFEPEQLDADYVKIKAWLDEHFEAIQQLLFWDAVDMDTHPLVKCAVFYGELTRNNAWPESGELDRQLLYYLFLKQDYAWASYIDLKKDFDDQQAEYRYLTSVFNRRSSGGNVTEWVLFFLSCLKNQQEALMLKLDNDRSGKKVTPKEKLLLHIIERNPAIKTSGISKKLGASTATVKRMLEKLIVAKLIERQSAGPGSYYTLV